MGKAMVLSLVALAVGLFVYWLARPRTVAPARERTTSTVPENPVPSGPNPPNPPNHASAPAAPPATGPIEPPRTEQEKEHDTLESRRAPLYGRLHQDFGAALVAVRPSDDDAATLDLYAAQDAPGNTLGLLNLALRANIAYYGFRHIRFYLPNPPQTIEKFRLDAEASVDSAGNWQTFKK